MKNASEVIHPGFETKVDNIRSPNQEYSWPNKKGLCCPHVFI